MSYNGLCQNLVKDGLDYGGPHLIKTTEAIL